jgi:hypothetical protein
MSIHPQARVGAQGILFSKPYVNKISNVRIKLTLWRVRVTTVATYARTMPSLCIVADLQVAVNNTKPLNVAREKQQWVPFAMLYSYKTFRTAVSNIG